MLQIRKLRPKKVAQGHTSGEWRSQDLNLEHFIWRLDYYPFYSGLLCVPPFHIKFLTTENCIQDLFQLNVTCIPFILYLGYGLHLQYIFRI